jgi:very-short-patch-repair endonuclease
VRQGLGSPVLQFSVHDGGGRFVARVDLAYPADRILIEYDSFEHHTGAAALFRDSARRNALTELGFNVLTATTVDVRDRAQGLARAIRRLRDRAA